MTTIAQPAGPVFGPQVIGQTEKALNTLLERQLAGTSITEPQWVTLTLTVVSNGTLSGDALAERISHSLKVDQATAHQRIVELTAANLVRTSQDGIVEATEDGRAQWNQVRAAIARITEKLWGDLPEEDLATAGRVLNTVLSRANTLLSAA
ncbi:MarR family winged helix-turn-helix transcriptional regulator [Nonomuraea ceibae]|uniref:MarR family winged helix-turn-helix transcriptional regulator n=1 Tax=Nonomuraea ceibae TaxID=1935170 RepID=UPI001C607316|nr:winged helix DNA-binding protein [Nonomuraea ceibae]